MSNPTLPASDPTPTAPFRRASRRLPPTAALGLTLALLRVGDAGAAVRGTYEMVGHDLVKYSYRIDNAAGLFDIAAWSLDLDLPAPDWDPLDRASGGEVAMPDENWIGGPGTPVSGLWAQDFLSLTAGAEIGVGGALDGFWFLSHLLPGEVRYHEFSATGESASGVTIGPAVPAVPVPEGGLWTAGAVVGGLTAATVSRRRGPRVTHASPR